MDIVKSGSAGKTVYTFGRRHRFTIYSESLVRMEHSGDGIFYDDDPLILDPSFAADSVDHTAFSSPRGGFILETKYFRLEFGPSDGPFDVGNLKVRIKGAASGDYVFEPGKDDDGNAGGAYLDLYKYPSGKIYENFTEGIVSKNGYFLYRNHCESLRDPATGWFKKRSTADFQDWYLFAYGSDVKKALADYVGLFGKIPMIPRWALGYWYSRWHKFRDTEILGVIDRLRELDIPINVFVIDTDWRKHGWNGYEWNSAYFPDPRGFLSELKKRGITCCLNDHPGYGVSDELPADDPYRENIRKAFPEVADFRIYWNDPRYVEAWKKEIFTKILDEGVDFWWVDGWGASGGIMDLHSQMWLNRFYYEAATDCADGRRPMILSRWGGVGSHRYPVQFSGDTYSTFETIKRQISFTHQGGNLGAAWWSHDIGGFLGGSISEELFVRWVEFGCFSPIFRTHSSGASRDVWNYSQRAVGIFRKYTKIRYALMPYIYSLARECSQRGIPPFRGLYTEYPRDTKAYDHKEEYLMGSRLLVAPAYGPGEVFTREVYFPQGSWLPLETGGDVIAGPAALSVEAPLEAMPLFAGEGAIISTSPPAPRTDEAEPLEFFIFPADGGISTFTYYEDDGKTRGFELGEFSTRKIEASDNGRALTITVHPSEGSYAGMPEKRNISFVIFTKEKKPASIKINGRAGIASESDMIFSKTLKAPRKFIFVDAGEVAGAEKLTVELTF